MNFNTKPRDYFFANKDSAVAFREAARRCRTEGRMVLRKTLATKAAGKHFETDTRHENGYVVRVRAFAMADEIELAELAKSHGRIDAPHKR